MPQYQENSSLLAVEHLSADFFRLTLTSPRISGAAQPGQFVMVACSTLMEPLLRRPFSIHRVLGTDRLQLLIRTVGKGTELLARMTSGQQLSLIGPLGHGFQLEPHQAICLIGGGIGIAPLLFVADQLRASGPLPTGSVALLGSRTGSELTRLVAEFAGLGLAVETATDDGSLGHHGLITDLLPAHLPQVKAVHVCGPHPMMATVAELCRKAEVECQASLEAYMACGLGACLGCTVHGTESLYRHVCKHGPVFRATEVAWKQ